MGSKTTLRRQSRRLADEPSDSRELLQYVAAILVHTGHSPKVLVREFDQICGALKEPATPWNPRHLDFFADVPHVIAHWHSDPGYLDAVGDPLPLPLRGRSRSMFALIKRVLPGEDPAAVTATLMQLGMLRRRGSSYLPRARHFTYPGNIARIHGLSALLGMLQTVEHNVATKGKRPTILERTAVNPSFPVSALPAFHRRLKALAAEFLWNIDGDMRRHDNPRARSPRVRLGVGVYAFEGHRRHTARSRSPRSGTPRGRK